MNDFPRDLFGRPIFDTPKARQPALFGARHWFELGYLDGHSTPQRDPRTFPADESYRLGFAAALRDRQAGIGHTRENEARAWAQAVAVGNCQR